MICVDRTHTEYSLWTLMGIYWQFNESHALLIIS